jgi:hypothetical protein
MNDLVIVDIETYSFTTVNVVETAVPTPIGNCSLTAVGNSCFVFGGTDAKGMCYNDIRSLDVSAYLDSRDITVSEGASSDYSFKILIIGDACKCDTCEPLLFIEVFKVRTNLLHVFAIQLWENRLYLQDFQRMYSCPVIRQPSELISIVE